MKRIKLILSMLLAMLATQTTWAQETKVATSTFTEFADVDEMETSSFGTIVTEEGNNWVFMGAGNPEWPRCTTENGKFAIKLYGQSITLFSNYNLKGTVKKITIRAGGNLGSLVSYIWCSSDGPNDFELGSVDVSSSDVKDYVFTVDESAGSRSFVNDEEKKHIYVSIRPRSGSDAMILESITVEYVEEQMEDGTSGTIGGLTWKVEKLTEFPETYRLIISGTGVMPDFQQTWVNGQSKADTPWKDFEISEVEIKEGVSCIGNYAFYKQPVNSVIIPSTLTRIGDYAFQLNVFSNINLPEGLVSIGTCTFADNRYLESITIPSTVNSFGQLPFGGCSALKAIAVKDGNEAYESPNNCNAIIKKDGKVLVVGCSTTVIPDDVLSIGDYAFMSCQDLESIEIPASVTKIGQGVFRNCPKLKSLVLLNNVESIGRYAFYGCSGMESLTIGSGITSIAASAFSKMENLSDVFCTADPTALTWDDNNNAECCKSDGSTKFHVSDPAAWKAKFPDAHVQFVAIGSVETDEGDANGDGEVNVADIDFVIEAIGADIATHKAADLNGDGEINVADVDYIIERIK